MSQLGQMQERCVFLQVVLGLAQGRIRVTGGALAVGGEDAAH